MGLNPLFSDVLLFPGLEQPFHVNIKIEGNQNMNVLGGGKKKDL